jgi:hypothetical protein
MRVAVVAVAVILAAIVSTSHADGKIRHYRGLLCANVDGQRSWLVKTLADERAGSVDLKPIRTTVDALTRLRRPPDWHVGTRSGIGFHSYVVSADLIGSQLMADHDYHVAISDPETGRTMVVEFPDVACQGAVGSPYRDLMEDARAQFVHLCGFPHGWQPLTGRVSVTGVGFFDRPHDRASRDTAVNAVELHPVLAIEGSCAKTGPPAPRRR